MDTAEFLRGTPLFASCSDKHVKSIARLARRRTVAAGEKIIREDSQSTMGFYMLVEGSAVVTRGDHLLAEYAPGDYFGEIALLLDDTVRTATVSAKTDVTVLVITRWDFRALVKTNPEIAVELMAVLAKRLADTDRVLSE
ncbi:MAG: cyclic nucleotide-binding domain-containing protein [Acidobacteria bacterium]|nr:cyclic nucleotide-binding domain-containing protein [Acidobacteriota bacterium]MCH8986300.1 cyclic nucleotide-binding domain-containing protein [Acidobacteriota bacterium]